MRIFKSFASLLESGLTVILFVIGITLGLSAALAIMLWLYAYLPNPDHPHIGGSPFTLAQVAAIFGGLGIAAGFSAQVNGWPSFILRLAGMLYLISALGFSLFGMTLPLSTDDELWARQGHVLEKMHFVFLTMAMFGFSFGTMLWVSTIHRLLGFQSATVLIDKLENDMTSNSRMKLPEMRTPIVNAAKGFGRGFLYFLVSLLAVFSFNPALLADTQGRPLLGHVTLVIWMIAAMLIVGFRSRLRNKPLRQCFIDGIVAAAITYAATALVSQVLQDLLTEIEIIRSNILWQILVISEIVVVAVGTVFLINLSTAGKNKRTFHVGGPEQDS